MAFRYSCFISYAHGQHELMKKFIEDLIKGLNAHLDPWLRQQIYQDERRLKGGHVIDDALARAMCESVCMILVFSPTYLDRYSPYCAREYRGMVDLERRRLALVSQDKRTASCIIPVIFRGSEHLPEEIGSRKFYDFSKYTLATPDLNREDSYIKLFEEIGQYVYGLYNAFADLGPEACQCDTFGLPTAEDAVKWLRELPPRQVVFPGRSG
jgi:hypothetical protein